MGGQHLSIAQVKGVNDAVGTKLLKNLTQRHSVAESLRADDYALGGFQEQRIRRFPHSGIDPDIESCVNESIQKRQVRRNPRPSDRIEIGDINTFGPSRVTGGSTLPHCRCQINWIGRFRQTTHERPIVTSPPGDGSHHDSATNIEDRDNLHRKKLPQVVWKAIAVSLKFFDRLSSRDSIDVSPRIPSRGRQSGLRVVFTPNPAWQGRRAVRGDCSG